MADLRLILLLLLIQSVSALLCPDQYCGTLPIRFPLWLKNTPGESGDSFCGHPELGIDCDANNTAILRGKNDTYVVAYVNYDRGFMTFKDKDLLSGPCPRAKHNLTLNREVLIPGNNNRIFFFFDCTNNIKNDLGLVRISCLENRSFAGIFDQDPTKSWSWWEYCKDHVISPVERAANGTDLNQRFGSLLKKGFEVKFNLSDDCSDCTKRRGTCAYVGRAGTDSELYRFQCLAPTGRNSKMKILIGVAAGSGGVLLACLFCLLFRRKKSKALNNSSKLLSWAPSSDTSSRKDLEGDSDLISGTPFFRYEELQNATSGFSSSNELGEGGFGIVYKGKLKDGRMVAVKRLFENNFKRVEQFMNEVVILNRLRHPNLVNLYGCTSRHSRELLLVYEYVPNGTVADHLHGDLASQQVLTWPLRLTIATETASAIAYLHAAEPPIIHRDIKTNNILLDVDFHVKVADFGLSRLYPIAATHVSTAPQGTPGYVDPEYHRFYQLTDKSDVYSFGVVLVELISSLPAVDLGRRRAEVNLSSMAVERIQNGRLDELVDPRLGFEHDPNVRRSIEAVAELAFRCLQDEKEMRPTMEDALEVLFSAQDNRRVSEDSAVGPRKTEEMVLLKGPGPPLTPSSIMDAWVSRATTPAASG
ncbi:serine/Threonine kinase family catalytic domain protein isoform X1 [Wolffia australiana]